MKFVISTIFLFCLLGCGNSEAKEIGKNDIIKLLNTNDILGNESETLYGMIGAIDGFKYKSDGFAVEFYKFKSDEIAKKVEMCEFINKSWCLFIHKGDNPEVKWKKIVKIFQNL